MLLQTLACHVSHKDLSLHQHLPLERKSALRKSSGRGPQSFGVQYVERLSISKGFIVDIDAVKYRLNGVVSAISLAIFFPKLRQHPVLLTAARILRCDTLVALEDRPCLLERAAIAQIPLAYSQPEACDTSALSIPLQLLAADQGP